MSSWYEILQCVGQAADDRIKAVFSMLNLIDLMSFAPQLLEPVFHALRISVGLNLQWFRIFRFLLAFTSMQ